MNKNYILITLAFLAIAIFGPLVGEQVAEKRMIRIMQRLHKAHEIERVRLEKQISDYLEVIETYRKELER